MKNRPRAGPERPMAERYKLTEAARTRRRRGRRRRQRGRLERSQREQRGRARRREREQGEREGVPLGRQALAAVPLAASTKARVAQPEEKQGRPDRRPRHRVEPGRPYHPTHRGRANTHHRPQAHFLSKRGPEGSEARGGNEPPPQRNIPPVSTYALVATGSLVLLRQWLSIGIKAS